MAKGLSRIMLAAFFVMLTLILILLGKYANELVFSFYPALSRGILGVLADFFGLFPVAMWELLLLTLVFWGLYTMIRDFAQLKFFSWLSGLAVVLSAGGLIFVFLWGLNYFAPPMHERVKLSGEQYTVKELKAATIYFRDRANQSAYEVQRDEEGRMLPGDLGELAKQAGQGYERLGEKMSCFRGSVAAPKTLLSSPLMGATGTTGIFIAFTGESCISTTTYSASVPFTMCHEIGHRMAFAREDEANFAGFLACLENSEPEFRYSGYYTAFSYCYNALAREDPEGAKEVWRGVGRELAADGAAAAKHYQSLENETLSSASSKVYDSYLKTFEVESGVQSYGEVTDLLLMWYYETIN